MNPAVGRPGGRKRAEAGRLLLLAVREVKVVLSLDGEVREDLPLDLPEMAFVAAQHGIVRALQDELAARLVVRGGSELERFRGRNAFQDKREHDNRRQGGA